MVSFTREIFGKIFKESLYAVAHNTFVEQCCRQYGQAAVVLSVSLHSVQWYEHVVIGQGLMFLN